MKKICYCFFILCILISNCYGSESKKLIVLLDWFANPNHAPLFVAQQQGFFKEQGLDVELIGPADPNDPPKLVAAGKADIAITYEPQLIEQIERDLPLVRIGTLIDKPLACLVTLKSNSIHSIADLKGKRIGSSTGDINDITLKVMLEKNGLRLNEVKHINVHYDLTQALLSKKVDAVTGMMRNFELTQLELADNPGIAFYPEKNGVPPYSELVFVARNTNLHDPRFLPFLIAVQKGVNYLQKNPESSWKEFAKHHPELNDELNKRAWFETITYFTKTPAKFDKKIWINFIRFMQQQGLIKEVKHINKYAIDLSAKE